MRVLVVGAGHMGLRHIRNLLDLGHEVEVEEPNREAMAEALRVGAHFPSESSPDAAVVATPPHIRPWIDIPVFYEKPLALSPTDALFSVGTYPRGVAVGYNWRFDPRVELFREQVRRSKVYSARIEFGHDLGQWWPGTPAEQTPYAKTGVLLEASHELDLARWIFGEPTVLGAWVGNRRYQIPAEDTALATLDCSGVPVSVSLDMTRQTYLRIIAAETDAGLQWVSLDRDRVEQTYRDEVAAFCRWVESGERDPRLATFEDGLAALELATSIRDAGNRALAETEGDFAALSGWRV